jgi:hypothetical protein
MAPPASSLTAMPLAGHPEPLPVSPGSAALTVPDLPAFPALPTTAGLPTAAAAPDNRLRPLDAAVCSLCGVARPLGLLVPDGSTACADVHWYCKDVKSCTERWTAARSR